MRDGQKWLSAYFVGHKSNRQDKIFLLEPEAAPLYVLVSRLKKNSVYSYEHSWLEDVLNAVWTFLTSSITAAAGTIYLGSSKTDYQIVRPYDILRITDTGAPSCTISKGDLCKKELHIRKLVLENSSHS